MIKLKGLFETSLGGFPCIRGYAKMGDLAKISKPEDYQRDLLSEHKKEMIQFFSEAEYLFFPEIVLSCKLRYDYNREDAISGLNPINDVVQMKNFKSNVDKTSIVFQKKNGLATISINENGLNTLLDRVDGNHRLSASLLREDFKEKTAPFCIILLSDDLDGKRKDKVIFHNINFKAIPLKEEHSLKIILEDTELFRDVKLKEPSFGWEFYITRKIIADISQYGNISVLQKDEKYRTQIKEITQLLLKRKAIKKSEKSIDKIKVAIAEINHLCKKKSYLGKNTGVFSALVIIQIERPSLLDSFVHWIENNQLYQIPRISISSLLDIFKKQIDSKSRNIFIALEIGHKETERNFEILESVIKKINEDYYYDERSLRLKTIRIDKTDCPHTFGISELIATEIEDCGLFIADITSDNSNVYHEVGYALGYIKGRGLENKIVFILHHKEGDPNVNQKPASNISHLSQVRFYDRKQFRKRITKIIMKSYGLCP